jgi:hypothetical protein
VRQWGKCKEESPQKCDRQLLEKLEALKAGELTQKARHYLPKEEVNDVMARRDKIVAASNPLSWEKAKGNPLLAVPTR